MTQPTSEGMALYRFRSMRDRISDLDRKIGIVTAYRDRLVTQRDHKDAQIPLNEREASVWAHKIGAAEQQLADLQAERTRVLQGA